MKYIELKWFLLLLALIILFLIGEEIFVYFGDPTSNFFFLSDTENTARIEYSRRFFVIAAAAIHIFLCIIALMIFIGDIRKEKYFKNSLYIIFAIYFISTLPVFFSITLGPEMLNATPTYYYLGKDLFENFLNQNKVKFCSNISTSFLWFSCEKSSVFSLFRAVTDVVSFATALGVPASIIGILLSTSQIKKLNLQDEDTINFMRIENLIQNKNKLTKYSTLSTLLLTTGVIYIFSWMIWPKNSIEENFQYDYAISSLSFVIFYGVNNSLVLASCIIPVSYFHNISISRVVAHLFQREKHLLTDKKTLKTEEWKKALDFGKSHIEIIRLSLALALPIIPGIIGFLGEFFT